MADMLTILETKKRGGKLAPEEIACFVHGVYDAACRTARPETSYRLILFLGTTGVGLALLTRIKEKYGSIEEKDIIEGEKQFR